VTCYITLGEYFWLGEQVTGSDAEQAMLAIAAGEGDEAWAAEWLGSRVVFENADDSPV